ncbi:cryptochrome/photolyase family protein [Rhabdothermincola sp.]|uniref:cryptochrome/photolyase family protein n=1 Tax=Rhabdothermincola sp. TaxID=2820405 RepID=UPI002FE2BD1D
MPGSEEIAVVWFRRDLRLDDNPAWAAATSERRAVVPLFVVDPRLLDAAGPFRRRQLLASVQALDYDLFERVGGRLLVRIGDPVVLVPQTVARYQAGAIYWNADVSPFAARRDQAVAKALDAPVHTFHGTLVHPPGSILTSKGSLSRVFNAFFKVWRRTPLDPWPAPGDAVVLDHPGQPLPALDGPSPFPEGELEARTRLEAFLAIVDRYDADRDRLDRQATSRLSVDLKYGTLSPRAVLDAVGDATAGREALVRQLAWRDWFAHLLAEIPSLPTREMKPRYTGLAWRDDPVEIAAWKGGFTGIPIIDAGMRELRQTGWMHNRLRMLCASFLVKNLLVDWRIGERHFRHLLVDGDVAQNVGNWQWVAGTGPDAAPYHRIFNPVTQGRRHDPDGSYVRRWVPELAPLDSSQIHAPWEVDPAELARRGVTLGDDYPHPIVDLAESRARALEAYAELRAARS